jgi:hypothetical protein
MSSIVMTIHSFNNLYAGFSASETQSSTCHHLFLSARRAESFLISEARSRHLRSLNSGKYYFGMSQEAAEICGGELPTLVDLRDQSSARSIIQNENNSNSTSTR